MVERLRFDMPTPATPPRLGNAKFPDVTDSPSKTRTLADLSVGDSARIVGFEADDVVCRRLFDLGFAPGLIAELERKAPLRDPLMFNVGGTEIVLRRSEAARILVTP